MLIKIILKIHVFIFIRNIKIPTFRCTVVCFDLFEQICCTILSTVSQMHFKSSLSSWSLNKRQVLGLLSVLSVRLVAMVQEIIGFHGNAVVTFIIVVFFENATIGYSLESVCVCVCVCVCVFAR